MIVSPAQLVFKKPRGFIVFEGANGAGKSTLQKRIAAHCRESGVAHHCTFEPGATPLGIELRKLLLTQDKIKPTLLAELFLFAADRHEHVTSVIEPALLRNEIVLCDRFLYSTIAFQGYGRGLQMDTINRINEIAIQGTLPDVVIILDLDPKIGLERANKRPQNTAPTKDSFEQEALEFHERIRNGFLEIARIRPEPFVILDATQSPEVLFNSTKQILDSVLAARIV